MKTRKRLFVVLLVLAFVLTLAIGIVGCNGGKEPPQPPFVAQGEEATYFCDGESGENTIQLRQGQFVLSIAGDNKTGSYTYDKAAKELVLTLADQTNVRGTLDLTKGELTIRYNNVNYVMLKKVEYTVTFDTNGGSAVQSVTAFNGKTISKPNDPTKAGHVFAGWYTDSALTKAFNFKADKISGNITLYARFIQETDGAGEFSVKLVNGGQVVETRTTINGFLYNLPELTSGEGTFLGWWLSDINDAQKLTRQYLDTEKIQQNTSLYAVWESDLPAISVYEDRIEWNDLGADRYDYIVRSVGETSEVIASGSIDGTSAKIDFSQQPAGEYEIIVLYGAKSATAYYHHKTLAQVSLFEVNGNDLVFNKVANATEYYITMKCGDITHDHTAEALNGSSTYNFANCQIGKNGYEFTVTASASGYVSSVSETFVYNRTLGQITNLKRDSATETLTWDKVEGATSYLVKITVGDQSEEKVVYTESIFMGNYRGNVKVEVTPVAFGYNASAQDISYVNNRLVAPSNIRVNMSTITWDAVEGATSYIVKIGDKEYVVYDNSLTMDETYYVPGQVEYVISIKAVAANSADSSMFSEEFRAQYGVMGSTITYKNNVLTWDAVFGAAKYVITINAGEETEKVMEITDGSLSATIVWPRAGVNTISVYSEDKDGVKSSSVSTQVTTYAIEFVVGDHSYPIETIYKAVGDEYVLPDAIGLGQAFGGWYDRADYENGKRVEPNGVLTEAQGFTVYAGWTAQRFTVTLDLTGEGELPEGTDTTKEVVFGSKYTLPVPTTNDTSVAFSGWYSEPNGAGKRYTDEQGNALEGYSEVRGRILYAGWVSVFTFEVVYNEDSKEYDSVAVYAGPGIRFVSEIVIPTYYYGKLEYVEYFENEVGEQESRIVTETRNWLVREVPANSFKGITTLVSVKIPSSIKYVAWGGNGSYYDGSAFTSCSAIQSYTVYDANDVNKEITYAIDAHYWSQDGVLYVNDKATSQVEVVYYPYAKPDAVYNMPYGVTNIPQYTFRSTNFVNVTLPASIKQLNKVSFYSCTSLVSIVFMEPGEGETASAGLDLAHGTTTNAAIYSCSKLTSITFPLNLQSFYSDSIQSCSALAVITIGQKEGVVGDAYASQLFKNANGEIVGSMVTDRTRARLIYVPRGYLGEDITNETGGVIGQKFIIPNGITSIDMHAFGGTSSTYACKFTDVYIPGTVTEIGAYAFQYCTPIKNLVFMGTKEDADLTIREYAFVSCTGLTEVTLPANLVKLEACAFSTTSSLTTVYVEADRDSIEYEDFAFGTFAIASAAVFYVQNVHLSATVPEINFKGVFGNTVLQGVFIHKDNPFYKSDEDGVVFNRAMTKVMFFPMGKGGSYTLPDTIAIIAAGTFSSSGLAEIVIPASVTEIGSNAFADCANLTKVTFLAPQEGKEVATLVFGEASFAACNALQRITIPWRTIEVGRDTFENCLNLHDIQFEETPAGQTEFELEIGMQCFEGVGTTDIVAQRFTKITLPERTTIIGNLAFQACTYLREANIPKNVEYLGTYLKTEAYTISVDEQGNEVTSELAKRYACVSMSVFYQCYSMERIDVDPANKFYASVDGVLYSKEFIDVSITNYVQATVTTSGVRTEYYAFNDNKYYDYTDGTIKTLMYCPPANSGINGTLTIPNTIMGIWWNAFGYNGDSDYHAEDVGIRKIQFTKENIENRNNNTLLINNDVFAYAEKIQQIQLPRGVRRITAKMFYYCESLTSIVIPNTVAEIEGNSFSYCSSLTTVTFEDASEGQEYTELEFLDTTSSSYGVFEYCDNLTKLSLPERTTRIGKYSLACTIGEVELPSTLEEVAYYGFYYCTATKISFPNGLKPIGQDGYPGLFIVNHAFYYMQNLVSLELPEGVTDIGYYAFYGASKLTEIHIPSTVTKMGAYTSSSSTSYGYSFYNLSKLEKLTFAEDLMLDEIPKYTFAGCSSLPAVEIPARIETIGDYAFNNCKALASVTFAKDGNGENHLASIGNYAFQNTAFSHFEFPNTTAGNILLGNSIFNGNVNLTSLHLSEDVSDFGDALVGVTIREITVDENNRNFAAYKPAEGQPNLPMLVNASGDTIKYVYGILEGEIAIPEGIIAIDSGAFRGQTLVTKITLPGTLNSIGTYAFSGCINLTEVSYIVTTLHAIPNYAFENCKSLKTFVIPDYVGDFTIGDYAFAGAGIESITIPSNVVKIGQYAFRDTARLTSLVIPDSDTLALSNYAFAYAGIESVEFKGNVKSMGEYLFYYCTNLSDVTFGVNATLKTLPKYMFGYCSSLKTIDLDNLVAMDMFGTYCFAYSGLVEFEIPEKITYLNDKKNNTAGSLYLFYYAKDLTTVYLHEGITILGSYTFYYCDSLKYVQVGRMGDTFEEEGAILHEGIVTTGNYLFGYSGIKKVHFPSTLKTMGTYTFSYAKVLEEVDFAPNSNLVNLGTSGFASYASNLKSVNLDALSNLTFLGTYAFRATGIESIRLPDGITMMGSATTCTMTTTSYVFYQCYSLKTVDLNKCTKIGTYTFYYCENLETVIGMENLTVIGTYAFRGCSATEELEDGTEVVTGGLKSVTLGSKLTNLGYGAFASNHALETVVINKSNLTNLGYYYSSAKPTTAVSTTYYGVFRECTALKNVTIPSNIAKIEWTTFYDCTSLTNVDFLNAAAGSLSRIDGRAFQGSGVTSVDLSKLTKLNSIGYYAFANAENLTSVKLPADLAGIEDGAFENAAKLSTLDLASATKLTSIGASAFEGCTTLASIKAPSSLDSIGDSAFANCTSLVEADLSASAISTLGEGAFQGCVSLTTVKLPGTMNSLGAYSFAGCVSLKSIALPKDIVIIGGYAFYNCTQLQSIDLGALLSLEEIGEYAYANCSAATSLTLPEGALTTIADGAFENCSSIASLTLPSTLTTVGSDAFNGLRSITSVTIPAKLTEIGAAAFGGLRNVSSIAVDSGNAVFMSGVNGELVEKDGSNGILRTVPAGFNGVYTVAATMTLGAYPFKGCSGITNVVFEAAITEITPYSFGYIECAKITIPNTVTKIGAGAFYHAFVTELTIPASVTEIGTAAFAEMPNIKSITLPGSVERIGQYLFDGSGVEEVVYAPVSAMVLKADGVETEEMYLLTGTNNLKTLTVEEGVTRLGKYFVKGLVGAEVTMTFPSTLKEVTYLVTGCNGCIFNVTFAEGLEKLGDYAFDNYITTSTAGGGGFEPILPRDDSASGGSGGIIGGIIDKIDGIIGRLPVGSGTTTSSDILPCVINITLPSTCLAMGEYVFQGCYIGTNNFYESNIEEMGSYVFARGYAEEIRLPHALVTLGGNTFYYANLGKVVFPGTIEAVGRVNGSTVYDQSFYYAVVDEVVYEDGAEAWSTLVPSSMSYGSFYYAKVNKIVLSSTWTKFINYQFAYIGYQSSTVTAPKPQHYLESPFVIPEGIKETGTYTFYYARIRELYVPDTLAAMGNYSLNYIGEEGTIYFRASEDVVKAKFSNVFTAYVYSTIVYGYEGEFPTVVPSV